MNTPIVVSDATRALYHRAYALSVALDDARYDLPRDIDVVVSTACTATEIFKLNCLLMRQFRDAVPRPSTAKALPAAHRCYLRVIRGALYDASVDAWDAWLASRDFAFQAGFLRDSLAGTGAAPPAA